MNLEAMKLTSFFEMFPDLINKEFRNIFIENHSVIPDGNYAFAEFYCDRSNCDCRKVMIRVMTAEDPNKTWAMINYGWESEKFYKKWFRTEDDDLYKLMMGTSLDAMTSPKGSIPNALLSLFEDILSADKAYAKRLEDHYWKVKKTAKEKRAKKHQQNALEHRPSQTGEKIGRNEDCLCGSGKKFKKCCLLLH